MMNVKGRRVWAFSASIQVDRVRQLASIVRDWGLLFAWLIAPAVVWLASAPFVGRFATPSAALHSVAIVVALVGFAGFTTNLILGARIPASERIFGDLSRAYRVHRLIGYGVPILLVGHMLLMAASRAVFSLSAALTLFTPTAGLGIFLGVTALIALVALLLSPLVVHSKHEAFLRLHRAVGLIFGIVVLHVFLVPAAGALSPALKADLTTLAAVAVASWLYRSALGRFLVRRSRYTVEAVNRLDASAVEIVLTPLGEPLRHQPGQFAFLTFIGGSVPREAHAFSITSGAADGRLRFVVKALGDFTHQLQDLHPGTFVEVEGPFGRFSYRAVVNPRQIWIAGGIGVTPFLSMARSLDDGSDVEREIDFYYCTERAGDDYFIDELFVIADRNPRFRVVPIHKASLGHITAEDVRGASPVLGDHDVFICGPPAMRRNLTHQFRTLGVRPERIHFEDFASLAK